MKHPVAGLVTAADLGENQVFLPSDADVFEHGQVATAISNRFVVHRGNSQLTGRKATVSTSADFSGFRSVVAPGMRAQPPEPQVVRCCVAVSLKAGSTARLASRLRG